MTKGDDVIRSKDILEYSDFDNVKGIEYSDDNFVITKVSVSRDEYHNEKVIIPGNETNWRTFKKYYFSK